MFGLTNDELARCAIAATIPANPAYSSLNLAAAVQVVAYELRAAAAGTRGWEAPRYSPATYDEIEGLHSHAQRTLTVSSRYKPKPRDRDRRGVFRCLKKLRQLLPRGDYWKNTYNPAVGYQAPRKADGSWQTG